MWSGSWVQAAKLTASDGAADDFFGYVSIDGDLGVVGALGDDDNGEDFGSAYFFDLNCPTDRPADLDANGDVGFGDLLIVLAAWGPCEYGKLAPLEPAFPRRKDTEVGHTGLEPVTSRA